MKSEKKSRDSYRPGHRKRLRERYFENGIQSLTDIDIVELLLTFGVPRTDMRAQAIEILNKFGSLYSVFNAEKAELAQINGVGDSAAFGILFTAAAYKRAYHESVEKIEIKIDNYNKAVKELEKKMSVSLGALKDEHVYSLYLDNAGHVLKYEAISKGTVGQAEVYPRKILETALLKKASSVILVHNHPSDNPQPSETDITLTKKIEKVLSTAEISLLDHIIVSKSGIYSFRENGFF
ncbi:DNA repair protein RadC [candidate division WOR-3 bacterium]|nr:DNA repair protein RadC [candidate division WOR-3 bacterium]